jgi:hypothetical protein
VRVIVLRESWAEGRALPLDQTFDLALHETK